ncbi:MAG: ATP-binding protein [Faecousia sp.]
MKEGNMAFDALLGNDRLKENLARSLEKNHISHFYLISGPRGSGKKTLAKLMAQAFLCQGRDKPCGVCEPCRKLHNGNHPDFITVEDPEHKNVAVKIVRDIREDVFIRPNESDYKIYLFPQDLGMEGQNSLLKILEEPPPYGIFLLLTDNPEKILPTVRSRCTELKMQALPRELLVTYLSSRFPAMAREDLEAVALRSGGFLGQALTLLESGGTVPPQTEAFVEALCAQSQLLLAETLVPMEKWKRDALAEILQSWLELTEEALAQRSGRPAISPLAKRLSQSRTAPELLAMGKILNQAIEHTLSNVSPGAVCGWLLWKLK